MFKESKYKPTLRDETERFHLTTRTTWVLTLSPGLDPLGESMMIRGGVLDSSWPLGSRDQSFNRMICLNSRKLQKSFTFIIKQATHEIHEER